MNAQTLFRPIRRALFLATASAGLTLAQSTTRSLPRSLTPSLPDTNIRIMLLTMGQGDQVWELFGHNAIWVHDPSAGPDSVYNWGVFDFNTPGFVPRFLRGDMRYTMDAQTIGNTVLIYQYLKRRIWAHELALTPAEKRAVVDYIRWNYRPENRQYHYNYFLDNCSTRVRDVIDRALGGQLRTSLRGIPTTETYRSNSVRMMQGAPVLVTGLDMALGRSTDSLLTADQASFLPDQLMVFVKQVRVGADQHPLVLREWMLNEPADRGPEATTVPTLWKWYLPISLVTAAVILGLWFGLRARIATGSIVALLAGFTGIVGTIIVLMVTVTDHIYTHRNENLWMLNPIWLVVAVVLARAVIRGRWAKAARWATAIGAGLSLCAVLMHVFGLSQQSNWDIIALMVPVQLAITAVAWRKPPLLA